MKYCLLIAALFGFSAAIIAQAPQGLPLYTTVPNSKPTPAAYVEKNDKGWVTNVSVPTITPYLPEAAKATGAAIIVFPGGGYAGLAINHEGYDVAKRFADSGIAAFVVKYRLPSDDIMNDRSIGPLQDAQRAIQFVREHAAEYRIDPKRVGIIGFSAGGHLASTLGTHFDNALIENKAGTSLRPDFMALIYPVITMGKYTHTGSRDNLIGATPAAAQLALYSNEQQVMANTPPAFLLHCEDDDVVPVQNSLDMYAALLNAKVKSEMHVYPAGGHGFGMYNRTTNDQWFERLMNFLRFSGMIR